MESEGTPSPANSYTLAKEQAGLHPAFWARLGELIHDAEQSSGWRLFFHTTDASGMNGKG